MKILVKSGTLFTNTPYALPKKNARRVRNPVTLTTILQKNWHRISNHSFDTVLTIDMNLVNLNKLGFELETKNLHLDFLFFLFQFPKSN